MHQMRILSNKVSSMVLRLKKFEKNCENCKRAEQNCAMKLSQIYFMSMRKPCRELWMQGFQFYFLLSKIFISMYFKTFMRVLSKSGEQHGVHSHIWLPLATLLWSAPYNQEKLDISGKMYCNNYISQKKNKLHVHVHMNSVYHIHHRNFKIR
jgi:hypothetical protein